LKRNIVYQKWAATVADGNCDLSKPFFVHEVKIICYWQNMVEVKSNKKYRIIMFYEYNSEHYFKENCYDFLLKSHVCCT
jgi:hypothetical protein